MVDRRWVEREIETVDLLIKALQDVGSSLAHIDNELVHREGREYLPARAQALFALEHTEKLKALLEDMLTCVVGKEPITA